MSITREIMGVKPDGRVGRPDSSLRSLYGISHLSRHDFLNQLASEVHPRGVRLEPDTLKKIVSRAVDGVDAAFLALDILRGRTEAEDAYQIAFTPADPAYVGLRWAITSFYPNVRGITIYNTPEEQFRAVHARSLAPVPLAERNDQVMQIRRSLMLADKVMDGSNTPAPSCFSEILPVPVMAVDFTAAELVCRRNTSSNTISSLATITG